MQDIGEPGKDSGYSTAEFLKRRVSKTLIPFLFWSFVAELYLSVRYDRPIDWSFPRVMNDILNARTFSAYWFFLSLSLLPICPCRFLPGWNPKSAVISMRLSAECSSSVSFH